MIVSFINELDNIVYRYSFYMASLLAQMAKNMPDRAGDLGWIPGSGRSP